MLAYVFIDLFIVTTGFCFLTKRKITPAQNNSRSSLLFLCLVALLLFVFSAFRGNMTADYDNYVDLYQRYSLFSFDQIIARDWFIYPEEGYILFQFFTKTVFKNVLFIFILTSLFIVSVNVREIGKHVGLLGFLPVLLFVEVGEYYNSFNLIRQIVAATFVVLGSKYLYEKKFFKYALFIILAASFHKASLIMIPLYFLLNMRFRKRSILVYLLILMFGLLFLNQIISFVQRYYWSWYSSDGYGMSGYGVKNIILPCAISIVPIVYYFINSKTIKETESVWANASCLYLVFSIIGLRVFMISRLMVFFSLYSILAFSSVVAKIKDAQLRRFAYVGITIVIMAYGYLSKDGTAFNPYHFI